MVESKLVELVVAGSNPVGHPTFDFWPSVVAKRLKTEQTVAVPNSPALNVRPSGKITF